LGGFVLFSNLVSGGKKTNVLGKNRSREYSKGNKTITGKVSTKHTEDGHKQDT
jgi:hypothetical protein